MKILVVDDEQPARDRLKQLLDDEPEYEVVGEAANGRAAIEQTAELQPDILLLDIRMPGMDGIETAHHLNRLDNAPAIVFTTAYDEYAIDAFDARAVGYVLKPVRRSRLKTALEQASRLAPSLLSTVATDARMRTDRQFICARAHGELKLIPVTDIVCFRAEQKYVIVDHDEGQVLIDEPLKALAEEFSDSFVRIHRSALVAIRSILRLEKTADGKNRIVLRDNSHVDDKELIISRRHLAEVRKRLKGV
jgi:two-component system response regulator AlgR